MFSLGSAADLVELSFQQNGTYAPWLGFKVVNERADSGHGSGDLYALLVPQMDVWYHIIITVLYTGTAYAPYSAVYSAYINGVAVASFTAGAYPIKAARSFATLGSAPSNVGSQPLVDALLAINTFRVYDVAVPSTAAVLMYSGLHGLPTSVPSSADSLQCGRRSESTHLMHPSPTAGWLDGTHYGYLAALSTRTGVVTFSDDQYIGPVVVQ